MITTTEDDNYSDEDNMNNILNIESGNISPQSNNI